MKTYYSILGVGHKATPDDIEVGYKQQLKKWHPDMHPVTKRRAAEAITKIINQAHAVLSDPSKRKRYDLFLENRKTLRKAANINIFKLRQSRKAHAERRGKYVSEKV